MSITQQISSELTDARFHISVSQVSSWDRIVREQGVGRRMKRLLSVGKYKKISRLNNLN